MRQLVITDKKTAMTISNEVIQDINFAISITGFIACLYGFLQVAMTSRADPKERIAVLEIFIWLFIYDASGTAGGVMRGHLGMLFYWLIQLSNYTEFISAAFLVYSTCRLVRTHIGTDRISERFFRSIQICLMLQLMLIAVNLPTGLIFTIGEDNIYQRSPAYSLIGMMPMLMIVICFLFRIHEKDRLTRKQILVFDLCFMFAIVSMIIQIIYYGIMILELCAIISSTLLHVLVLEEQRDRYERQFEENIMLKNRLLLGQIEPHFLSNTLAMIRTQCDPGSEVFHSLTDLADYIRYGLKTMTGPDLIPVCEELEIVEKYLDLQIQRLDGRITVEWDIEDESFEVPAFCIQIPVENAIKHGFNECRVGGGKLSIRTYETDEGHVIQVEDDGVGFVRESHSNGIGLENIRNRLVNMCNGRVDITSTPGKGTEVEIVISKEGAA